MMFWSLFLGNEYDKELLFLMEEFFICEWVQYVEGLVGKSTDYLNYLNYSYIIISSFSFQSGWDKIFASRYP